MMQMAMITFCLICVVIVHAISEPERHGRSEPKRHGIDEPEPHAIIDPEPHAIIEPESRAISEPEPHAVSEPEPRAIIKPERHSISESEQIVEEVLQAREVVGKVDSPHFRRTLVTDQRSRLKATHYMSAPSEGTLLTDASPSPVVLTPLTATLKPHQLQHEVHQERELKVFPALRKRSYITKTGTTEIVPAEFPERKRSESVGRQHTGRNNFPITLTTGKHRNHDLASLIDKDQMLKQIPTRLDYSTSITDSETIINGKGSKVNNAVVSSKAAIPGERDVLRKLVQNAETAATVDLITERESFREGKDLVNKSLRLPSRFLSRSKTENQDQRTHKNLGKGERSPGEDLPNFANLQLDEKLKAGVHESSVTLTAVDEGRQKDTEASGYERRTKSRRKRRDIVNPASVKSLNAGDNTSILNHQEASLASGTPAGLRNRIVTAERDEEKLVASSVEDRVVSKYLTEDQSAEIEKKRTTLKSSIVEAVNETSSLRAYHDTTSPQNFVNSSTSDGKLISGQPPTSPRSQYEVLELEKLTVKNSFIWSNHVPVRRRVRKAIGTEDNSTSLIVEGHRTGNATRDTLSVIQDQKTDKAGNDTSEIQGLNNIKTVLLQGQITEKAASNTSAILEGQKTDNTASNTSVVPQGLKSEKLANETAFVLQELSNSKAASVTSAVLQDQKTDEASKTNKTAVANELGTGQKNMESSVTKELEMGKAVSAPIVTEKQKIDEAHKNMTAAEKELEDYLKNASSSVAKESDMKTVDSVPEVTQQSKVDDAYKNMVSANKELETYQKKLSASKLAKADKQKTVGQNTSDADSDDGNEGLRGDNANATTDELRNWLLQKPPDKTKAEKSSEKTAKGKPDSDYYDDPKNRKAKSTTATPVEMSGWPSRLILIVIGFAIVTQVTVIALLVTRYCVTKKQSEQDESTPLVQREATNPPTQPAATTNPPQ